MGVRRSIAEAVAGYDLMVVSRQEYLELLSAKADMLRLQRASDDALSEMMGMQRELYDLNGMPNIDYDQPLGHRAKRAVTEAIGDFVKSAIHEAVELENWLAWKPWSVQLGNKWNGEQWSDEHIKAMRMEVVDLLAFVFNLCCVLGMSPKLLYLMYCEKNMINRERHRSQKY